MFSGLRRKRAIKTALSREASFAERLRAISLLGEKPAAPEAIRALAELSERADELQLRQTALSRLANIGVPDSLRVLLKLVTHIQPQSWIFYEAFRGLSWNDRTLNTFPDEALASLLHCGKHVIQCNNNAVLADVRSLIKKIDSSAIHSALEELDRALMERRKANLPLLLRTALETAEFSEAEHAISEIAGLDSTEAQAALVRIRQQPPRDLSYAYEVDHGEYGGNYSPKTTYDKKSSTLLGETLSGPEGKRWAGAHASS